MPYVAYSTKKMQDKSLVIAERARVICIEYAQAGYSLTLRQLYYRFVANGWLPNTKQSYDRLGNIVNDARLAGIIDWDHLVDRTRNINKRGQWDHPRDILQTCVETFHLDYWADQDVHLEVWVEKEALADVVEQVAFGFDVTTLACRGYMSQSEQWTAARRFLKFIKAGKRIVVIHLGDHDPSGIDMSRDNEERLRHFLHHDLMRLGDMRRGSWMDVESLAVNLYGVNLVPEPDNGDTHNLFEFRRIALNMDQVEQYNPPPNFAKVTDSRFKQYEELYGDESWELDALPPDVLSALITDTIGEYMDAETFEARKEKEAEYRRRIGQLIEDHGEILDIDTETGEDDNDYENDD